MNEDFPCGTHAQITGLGAKPELNDQYCVSRGENPDNRERLNVLTRSGATLSIRASNLRPAELLPGTRVVVVGLSNAQQYNGQQGEVVSWQGDRWIVEMDAAAPPAGGAAPAPRAARKSFRSDNLVILPAAVSRKRAAEEPEVEAKKIKTSDMKELTSDNESMVAKALVRIIHEFPIVAQKCICCLATKQTITVQHELAQHITDKQMDGLVRRELKPGEKVKGIEELDALEQCVLIAERKSRTLANYCRINYCDLLGFLKQGLKEPKFNRGRPA